jgi:glc operon protein GlcG
VSVAVVDPGGALVAFRRDDAAHPGERRSLAGQGAHGGALPHDLARDRAAGRRAQRLPAGRGITPVEGAVPIVVDGQVVGAVGVSGVTSAQDAQIARAGAEALAAPSRSRGAP